MKANKLLKKLGIHANIHANIKKLSLDHRKIDKKTAFIALKGNHHDGIDFINHEMLNHVGIVLSYKEIYNDHCFFIPNLQYRLSKLVNILYSKILKKTKVIGIVGTCGKTTTATMIYQILKNANKKVIYFGTNQVFYNDKKIITNNTTLNPIEFINTYLSIHEKFEYLILEVSSHAILENRINFLTFNALIFTNFSQDHLDYHLTMENYFSVKKALFYSLGKDSYAIINMDDSKSEDLIASTNANIIGYGKSQGKYTFNDYKCDNVWSYNQYNMLAAYTLAKLLHINHKIIVDTLDHYVFEYGRSQIVYDKDYKVILDYAHTPYSLQALLKATRKQCKHHLIVIFGCGGNRDQDKRKKMGKMANQYADTIILTNDNPRNENPQKIIDDILVGCPHARIITDRKQAIQEGIKIAKVDDIVLVVGKGNENYQLIANQKIPFSDLDCIKESVTCHE